MSHPLVILSVHPQPVNKQAATIIAKTHPDNRPPMTPEQKVKHCKNIAKVTEKEYPPAQGRWTYVLNVVAKEMGYEGYDDMLVTLGLKKESKDLIERKQLLRQIQELQFKVVMLEEENRQLKERANPKTD